MLVRWCIHARKRCCCFIAQSSMRSNSPSKGSDASSAEGVPPISRKWELNQLQRTTQITWTHMLNTDLNAVNGFQIRSLEAMLLEIPCAVRGARASALQRMSWHYNASTGHCVCEWVYLPSVADHTTHEGGISALAAVVLVLHSSPNTLWLTIIWGTEIMLIH